MRVMRNPVAAKNATNASGSLGTLASRTISPVASTTQTLLHSKDTSIAA
jgi:hypothetical protein